MSSLSSRRIRAIADTAKFDGPTATATNAQLRMWNGSPTRFEWRFDYAGNLVTDLSNVTEMTMQIKSSADGRAPADNATPLVSKTISSFDSTLDSGSWADGSKQHAAFTLTGAEANVGVGKCWIVLVASLSGVADPVTLCAGPLDVVGDGYDSGAGAPPSPAASYLNSSQSDARYLQLTGGTIAGNLAVTGNTTLGDAAGDSATINAGTISAPNATDLSANRLANVGALATVFDPIRTNKVLTAYTEIASATLTNIPGLSFSHPAWAGANYEFFMRARCFGSGIFVKLNSSSGTGFILGAWGVITREDTGAVVGEGNITSTGISWAGSGDVYVNVRGNAYLNPSASATTVSLKAAGTGGAPRIIINGYEAILRQD